MGWTWRRSPRPSATSGRYREQVLLASSPRRIEAVIARYRTKRAALIPAPTRRPTRWPLLRRGRRRRGRHRGSSGSRSGPTAGPASATRHVTTYDDESTDLAYTCDYGHAHTTNLATQAEGKLVWKVDWPMRWAFEHVDFEPAGMDHATPGSSFTVGHELVEKIFGMPRRVVRLRLRGLRGRPEDVLLRWRRPDRGGRAPGPRGVDPALALRAPAAAADLRHRLRSGGPPALRRVGRPDAQGRRPGQTRPPVLAWERASSTAAGALPAPGSSYRSGCCPRSPT